MIKLRILKGGRLSWIVWVGPTYNHKCPPKRKAGRSESEKTRPREEASTFWVPQVTGEVCMYLGILLLSVPLEMP